MLPKGGVESLDVGGVEDGAPTCRRQGGGDGRGRATDHPVDDADHVAWCVLLDYLSQEEAVGSTKRGRPTRPVWTGTRKARRKAVT